MGEDRIPFHIDAYDGDAAHTHPKDDGFADAAVDLPDGRYLVRHAFGTTLFRHADADVDQRTFFAFEHAPESLNTYNAWLTDILAKREYAPVVRYSPSHSNYEWDNCFLLLRDDGTGVAFAEAQRIEISGWYHPEIFNYVLEYEPEEAEEVAKFVFEEEVNKKLPDPFVDYRDLQGQSIEFICGSQQQLETVTRWIYHTAPEMFEVDNVHRVSYNSSSKVQLEEDEEEQAEDDSSPGPYSYFYGNGGWTRLPPRIITLLELAFEYNNFNGSYWEYNDGSRGHKSAYSEMRHSIEVKINAPSAHERAEALLQLNDWLQGKVPQSERKALLGNPPEADTN